MFAIEVRYTIPMSEMQFNTEQENEFGRPPQVSESASWSAKLVSWGLASNRQQAEYIMIAAVVLAALIAAYFIFGGSGSEAPPLLP